MHRPPNRARPGSDAPWPQFRKPKRRQAAALQRLAPRSTTPFQSRTIWSSSEVQFPPRIDDAHHGPSRRAAFVADDLARLAAVARDHHLLADARAERVEHDLRREVRALRDRDEQTPAMQALVLHRRSDVSLDRGESHLEKVQAL